MGLDVRVPLGWIFLSLGAILAGYGVWTWQSPMYGLSGGINLNLVWGSLMLLFGLVLVLAAKRARARFNH